MEKINIAQLLIDCPKGMELDCTMFENLEFDRIDKDNGAYNIICRVKSGCGYYNTQTFTEYGCYTTEKYSKCVIFPKGKTTWDGFVPPRGFKDGDIIADEHGNIAIYKGTMWYNKKLAGYYCGYRKSDERFLPEPKRDGHFGLIEELHYATEEEKQKLFDIIIDNGYRWNTETKTLEKLVEPEFNVGDWIIRNNKYTGIPVKVIGFNGYYSCELNGEVVTLTRNDVHNNFHLWTIQDAKDGDVLVCDINKAEIGGDVEKLPNIVSTIFNFKKVITSRDYIHSYCHLYDRRFLGLQSTMYYNSFVYNISPATKEQRDLLFQKIQETGYIWVAETKTLEKLPKFKVGNVIQDKDGYKVRVTEVNIEDECYGYESIIAKGIGGIAFREQDDWELAPNKFDINTLIPFESKVLVRHNKDNKWTGSFFSFIDRDLNSHCYKFVTTADKSYPMMIPYKGNESLLGKVEDCKDFYKIWE